MCAQREGTLEARRAAYGSGRLDHQRDWYRQRELAHARASRAARRQLLVAEAGALAAALGVAVTRIVGSDPSPRVGSGTLVVALLGLTALALAAWQQVRQGEQLAAAYRVTSWDLEAVATSLGEVGTEAEWARAVHEAEAAFSREHSRWVAARGRVGPS